MKGHFEWESNHVNFTERYRPLVLFARFAGRKQVAVLPQSWCFELLTYYVKRLWNPCSWKKIRKKNREKIFEKFYLLWSTAQSAWTWVFRGRWVWSSTVEVTSIENWWAVRVQELKKFIFRIFQFQITTSVERSASGRSSSSFCSIFGKSESGK